MLNAAIKAVAVIALIFAAACAGDAPPPTEEPAEPVRITKLPAPTKPIDRQPGDARKRTIKDLDLGWCSKPVYCGDLGKIDCNSAADGPLYYFRKEDGVIVSTCGGACMVFSDDPEHPCRTMCPPPEWTCKGAGQLSRPQ